MKRDGRNRFKRGLVSLLAILLILQLTVPCLLVSADTEDTAAEEALLAEEAYVEEPEEEETVPEEPVSEEADDVSTSDATPQEEAEDTVPKEDTEAELEEEEEEEDIEPEIEMESSEEWERELDLLTLTDDDWVENFVRIAASQLGYRENELTEAELESGYTQGWTRYGVWYGLPYEEWNTYFVDFCLYYAEVAGISFEPEAADWIYELGKDEMYTEPEDAEPKRGDLIFLDLYDNDGIADSVGIIEWALYDEDDQCEEIKVILGDYEDEVAEEAFYADDSRILGYTVLPEDPRSEKEVEENSVETEDLYEGDAQTFEDTVEGITVHVEAPAGAFPGETTMEVSPVEREAVLDAISQTIDGTIANVEAVDISFYDQDGEEIEPALPIRVLMSSQLIAKKDEAPTVVHIRDNADADVVPVDESAETSDSEVVFETASFSVYALVYTVDFELTDESGYRYTFSLDGGSQITLSTLLAELGIMDRKSAQKLIAEDVEDVTFSDESLVKVAKLEESTTLAEVQIENGLDVQEGAESTAYEAPDYLLMSLAAFDTAETLTITLRSGEQIVIQVTDERISGLNQIEDGARYLIYVQWSENGNCYVLKNDGTTAQVPAGELAGLGDEYYWEFTSKSGVTARDGNYNSINCYTIQAVTGNRRYLQPNEYPSTSQGATRLLVPWDDTYGCGVRQNGQGGTFNIGGLYDGPNGSYTYGGYLVLENNTLTENYWYATDVKLYKKSDTVTFNVKTENADIGTVSGRDYQYNELKEKTSFVAAGDNRSYNANPIYATPGANYEFAGWKWEGESGYAYTSSTIPAGALAVQAGKTLVATFKERSDIGDTGRRADRSLDAWIEGLLKQQIPLDGNSTSKTAEVYDYENRIYRVDLTAKSNLVTFNGTIDLGFILDMSGSMRFPSKLNKTGIALQLTNLNNGGDWQLDKNQVYYIITDAANTSTVRKVFYRSGGESGTDGTL
ncbi:MAG: hypothetical protein Q4B15_07425 [Lachnospiraceae bacterium]|nr:hypothetical protein [Lachnospiraceae bacterium]